MPRSKSSRTPLSGSSRATKPSPSSRLQDKRAFLREELELDRVLREKECDRKLTDLDPRTAEL